MENPPFIDGFHIDTFIYIYIEDIFSCHVWFPESNQRRLRILGYLRISPNSFALVRGSKDLPILFPGESDDAGPLLTFILFVGSVAHSQTTVVMVFTHWTNFVSFHPGFPALGSFESKTGDGILQGINVLIHICVYQCLPRFKLRVGS